MRKELFLVLVLAVIAVLAVSCSQNTTVTQTPGQASPSASTATPVKGGNETVAQQHASPDIDALTKSGYDCLKGTNLEVCRPVNYAIGSVGDTLGFAFGVVNDFPTAKKIAITVTFVNTQQGVGELPIQTDKDIMNQWLSVNNFDSYYDLQPHAQLSQPVLIKIGNEVANGVSTVPGAYVFEIQAKTYDNGFYDNYGGSQQVTVRIK